MQGILWDIMSGTAENIHLQQPAGELPSPEVPSDSQVSEDPQTREDRMHHTWAVAKLYGKQATMLLPLLLGACTHVEAATPYSEIVNDTINARVTETAPLPTATKVEPSPTPKPTETKRPTPTKTEILPTKEKVPWTEKYFLKKEDLPEGAIILEDMHDRKLIKELTVTGPGQLFYMCHILRDSEQAKKQNRFLGGWELDLSQPNYKYCVPWTATEQSIKDWISKNRATLSPEKQQAAVERKIALSQAFMEAVPKDYIPYLDAYYVFHLNVDDDDTTYNWRVYGKTYSNSKTTWTRPIDVLDIPLPASTPTSTPTP